MVSKNDIRYLAHCYKCGIALGDWALNLPEEERFCYDCKGPKIENLKKKWK